MVTFEEQVKNVAVGDRIASPFSGNKMLVRDIHPGMYGLVELSVVDVDNDRHLLSLEPDEVVKVFYA